MVNKPGRPSEIEAPAMLGLLVEAKTKKTLLEIAEREHKSVGELVRPILDAYAKAHAKGNPAYALDPWVDNPEARALPTIYEDPKPDQELTPEDAQFMVNQMAKWTPVIEKTLGWQGPVKKTIDPRDVEYRMKKFNETEEQATAYLERIA
jgi:hypothetical protein